jgi:hypothetical protein
VLAGDRDLAFLHRLQQRRLRPRAGAVDLVGHQQRQKIGPSMKRKLRAPSLAGFQHLGAQDVGRHQVGRELDAVGAEPHDGRQRVDQKRLAQPRQTHQKRVPPRQHRREAEVTTSSCPMMRVAIAARASASLPPSASISATRAWASVRGFGHGMAPHRAYLVSGNRPIPPTTNCKRSFGKKEGHIIVTDSRHPAPTA